MKLLFAAVVVMSTVGCVMNPQPVTYTDMSTPGQRNIQATGAAAVEAAKSNRSTNSHHESYDENGNPIIYKEDGTRDHRAELQAMYEIHDRNRYRRNNSYTDFATRQFKQQMDFEVRQKIRRETRRLVDKIF